MYLSVYGDSPINISLAVEWVTNSTAHYPTDLGAYIERTPTNPIGWVSQRATNYSCFCDGYFAFCHILRRRSIFAIIQIT